ncbi:sensor histidine kinase [Flavobacterium sp.]|uniref:sensor histidine kinase n=1 Tax=Flavobacterium sp. TaxID=239 RepID=UPI00286A2B19|nr:sensor histidine kinase [Flavobacterium sp.]
MNQIKEKLEDNQSLKWRFDVNTFRLLGRDLITDRITAVYELVKNCYDANSTKVIVDFEKVSEVSNESKISIIDNGIGMSFIDIRDKWMVVGTNSKRVKLFSDQPFNRKFVGEKGIGRFAVDKLGERVQIKTKQLGESNWLNVNINWDEYEEISNKTKDSGQLSLFTEVENKYSYETGNKNDQGTIITITKISEIWTENDIERLYKELSKLVSPFYPIKPPFNIFINTDKFKKYQNESVKAEPIKYYSHYAEIGFDTTKNIQETLFFSILNGVVEKKETDIKIFGGVKIKLFYFNESAKRKYNSAYKNDDTRIDGIKIYRDGIVTTPFAEYEDKTEKQRDILGIDKRRWRGTFDTIGTREVIGIVDITKFENPKIIDATNRQDFISNNEYSSLKEFILEQLAAFEKLKIHERTSKRSFVENQLIEAGSDVKSFEKELEKIEIEIVKTSPKAKENIDQLKLQAKELHTIINKGIAEQKKFQKEVERKEKILYSMVSMQEYASMIAHAVRTSIAKVKHFAEFIKTNYPNPDYDKYYKLYAVSIYNEMNTLISVTDFMLSFASVDNSYEDFNVSELIKDLLENQYETIFKNENIKLEIDVKDDFVIDTNKKAFQDVFQNLVSNSIKALKNTTDKKIKCTGFLNTDSFVIYFSDNGIGVDQNDKDWIFGLYNTRTAEQGGAGVGLYIVEKQIKALNGTIEVVESEFKPIGVTFKITIPFNR